jgi:hypothetical protein
MSATAAETAKVDALPSGLRKLGAEEGARTAAAPAGANKLVFHAAAKSVEFFDHLRAHYRETRRTSVEIPCELKFVMNDGTVFDTGTAVVRNVSPSGALLAGFKLVKGCFPASSFKVILTLKGGDYQGVGIEATPVRIVNEISGLGVKFDEIFVAV